MPRRITTGEVMAIFMTIGIEFKSISRTSTGMRVKTPVLYGQKLRGDLVIACRAFHRCTQTMYVFEEEAYTDHTIIHFKEVACVDPSQPS